MSNVLHSINRGFLIIGLTGPLSSGCSTAGEFFSKKIDSYIHKKTKKVLPKFESRIKSIYRNIADLRIEHHKKSLSENEKDRILEKMIKRNKKIKRIFRYSRNSFDFRNV
jgi:Na+/phosphate symporter